MKMLFKTLGEIAEVIAGQSPLSEFYNKEGKGLPFFQGKADYGEKYPKIRFWCTEPGKIALPNDILISVRAPVGPVNMCDTQACIGRGLSAIRVKSGVDNEYVFLFLKYNQETIARMGVGSTFSSITQRDIKKIKISIPEKIEDQIRIATILSKAEALITQRKESIKLLDELLKSTFLEMFGTINKNKYPLKNLEELCIEIVDCPHSTPIYTDEKTNYACIRTSELKDGYIDWNSMKYVSKEEYEKRILRLKPFKGDVVYGREGTFGDAIIVPTEPKFCLGQRTMLFRPNPEICNSYFLWAMVISPEVYIQAKRKNSGSTVGHVNVKDIKKFRVLLPPLPLQTQFAHIVEKVEALKTQYTTSLQVLENLYGSLNQKAFKGELNLKHAAFEIEIKEIFPSKESAVQTLTIPNNKKPFAKQVLGGKIVSLFKEDPNFTHIKFQKLQYLAEQIAEADLNWNYYRKAAGPYDPQFMNTVANKLKQSNWFEERQYKFYSLAKTSQIEGYYQGFFGSVIQKLETLFTHLKTASEEQAEIVATLYAVWNDFIIKKETISDEKIVETFFQWSDRKKNYQPEQVTKALAWMKSKGITPNGFGYLIKEKKVK